MSVPLLLAHLAATAQTNRLDGKQIMPGHPRILLLKVEEETLKRTISSDKAWSTLAGISV